LDLDTDRARHRRARSRVRRRARRLSRGDHVARDVVRRAAHADDGRDRRADQHGLRRRRRLGDREIRLPRQAPPRHAHRPAVLGFSGHRGARVRAALRRAGPARPVARRTRYLDRVRVSRHRARDAARHVPVRRARADPRHADAGPRSRGGRNQPRRERLDDVLPRHAAVDSLGTALWHHLVQCPRHGRVRRRRRRVRAYPRLDHDDAAPCRDPLQRVRSHRCLRRRLPADAARAADDDREDDDRALRTDAEAPSAAYPARAETQRSRHFRMKLRPPGLAGRLALVTALLVSLAVAAVSAFSARTMRRLAEAEAASRVELAVAGAREALRRSTEDLLSVGRVLAERPTLDRLLRAPRADALNPYLATYCDSAVLHGCALARGDTVAATSGEEIDWAVVLAAATTQGERFLVSGAAAAPLAGAGVSVPGHAEYTAFVVRKMDDEFAQTLSERIGIEVEIIDFASFRPGVGPFAVLHSDALASGEPAAARIDAAGVFAASLPVIVSTGETVALLQARLPIPVVMDPVDTATRRMLVVAAVIALLATAAGIAIGRQWISGVFRLAEAARRIGAGDLSASIHEESGKELGALSSTMEEMRRNLIALTSELRRR